MGKVAGKAAASGPPVKAVKGPLTRLEGVVDGVDTGRDAPAFRVALLVSVACNLVLGAVVCVLTGILVMLFPLKEKVPWLLTLHDAKDAVVEVQPVQMRSTAMLRAEEAWVRSYVLARESVVRDPQEMAERVRKPGQGDPGGFIARRSSPQVFESFLARQEDFIRQALARGVSREVTLEDPVENPGSGLWTVTLRVEERDRGRVLASSRWRVRIRVAFVGYEAQARSFSLQQDERWLAELFGFKVVQYDPAQI